MTGLRWDLEPLSILHTGTYIHPVLLRPWSHGATVEAQGGLFERYKWLYCQQQALLFSSAFEAGSEKSSLRSSDPESLETTLPEVNVG